MEEPVGEPCDRAGAESERPLRPLPRIIRDQRLAFALVGGLNTVISYAAFLGFTRLGSNWGGDLAVFGAQAIAIPIAFALHRRFVFRVTGHVVPDFGRFVLVNAIPIGVNLVVLPVLTTVLGWPVLLAQLLFTVAWVVASFFLHRGFSFRRTAAEVGSAAKGLPGAVDAPTVDASVGAARSVGAAAVQGGGWGASGPAAAVDVDVVGVQRSAGTPVDRAAGTSVADDVVGEPG